MLFRFRKNKYFTWQKAYWYGLYQHNNAELAHLLTMGDIILHEVVRLLPGDAVHVGHFVPELDTVEFVCMLQQLRSITINQSINPL